MQVFNGNISPAESTPYLRQHILNGGAACARAVYAGRKRGWHSGQSNPQDTILFIYTSSLSAKYKADAKD